MITAATTGREAWASARSASRLHALDGLEDVADLDLGCPHSVNVRLGGVSVRRTASVTARDLVVVQGVRCTNRARTLCDLASVVDPFTLERAFDDVIRRGAIPKWIHDTAERAAAPRLPGPGRVIELLELHAKRGTVRGSWFEKLIELCLDHPELSDLVIQHTLRDDVGRHVATFDLALPDAKLGIEGHSRRHHFGARHEASDEHRDNAAGALGWDVMYLGYADVHDTNAVRDLVVDRVRARRSLVGSIEHGTTRG